MMGIRDLRVWASLSIVSVGIVGIDLYLHPEQHLETAALPLTRQIASIPRLSSPPKTQRFAVQAKPARPTANSNVQIWREFQERFGEELVAQFDTRGRLVSIKGRPGQGKFAAPDFNPAEPQQAVARAREILEKAASLIGLE